MRDIQPPPPPEWFKLELYSDTHNFDVNAWYLAIKLRLFLEESSDENLLNLSIELLKTEGVSYTNKFEKFEQFYEINGNNVKLHPNLTRLLHINLYQYY